MVEVDITIPRKQFQLQLNQQFDRGITGIFGPSGSGKTSLLQAIAGLTKPASGSITLEGSTLFHHEDKINQPVEKRQIGYVFQEGRLFPHLSVYQNLSYGYRAGSLLEFDEVIELLQLRPLLNSKPHQISGGERQRTALGRSLLASPKILLLDEPFSAVDTRLRSQILPFILKVQQQVQIPILVVSHDLPDLLKLTHTLCILERGKCLGHGAYFDLIKSQNTRPILGSESVVNALDVTLDHSSDPGVLIGKSPTSDVSIRCEHGALVPGDQVKVFIKAQDIALSSEQVTHTTIQNQLPGTVIDIVDLGQSKLCRIDAGVKLLVKITTQSQQRLQLKPGSKVWCLFKSVAVDVLS